jgi:hypothetical protein
MQSYEKAQAVAREKLAQAEQALNEYIQGCEFDNERVCQLVDGVDAARDEFLRLLSGLTAHGNA